MCDAISCNTSKVFFIFEINTETFHPNVKKHESQMCRLLFAIQANYYLHLKLTRTLFTDMLKTCVINVNGLLFVIYTQLLFAKHRHTINMPCSNHRENKKVGRLRCLPLYPPPPHESDLDLMTLLALSVINFLVLFTFTQLSAMVGLQMKVAKSFFLRYDIE